ncbi:MAG TPA: DUF1207 domain-containing protein [Nitrospiraceae bacterium]
MVGHREFLFRSRVLWMCPVLLLVLPVVAASAEEASPATPSKTYDCRYESSRAAPSQDGGSRPLEAFPENDVFRPLLADPKQPQFFATYQAVRVRNPSPQANFGQSVNVGSVGFGENFGLVGRRNGCDGWQVGILAGVFAQFNLDASSADLINADYVVGFPISWRKDLFSARVRLSHQSSHLGDEFVLGNPGFARQNLSFEEVEPIVSLDTPGGWGRIYGGGAYMIGREPNSLDRLRAQWGAELRGPAFHWSGLERAVTGSLAMTPVFGADFKAFEELNWLVSSNVVAGVEWFRAGGSRRMRLMVNYYNGFSPFGQFFSQKVESIGVGIYLVF